MYRSLIREYKGLKVSQQFLSMLASFGSILDLAVHSQSYMLQLIFISVNFCFSFVLNSLAYITIPQNNGKMKINWNKKLTTTYI